MRTSEESLLALLEDDSPIEDKVKKPKQVISEELRQKRLDWLAKGRIAKGQSPSPERKAAMLDAMKRAKAAKAKKPNEFELTVTPIFIKNKECTSRIIVNRGGSRSGKSQALCQLLLERFFTYPKIQILILRKTLPALRDSTLKMMNNLVDDMNVRHLIREEKISLNWHNRVNGALIHFGSLDVFSKIKSSEWSDIWMEEANEFLFDDFIILNTRLSAPILTDDAPRNQMFLSLNPDSENCWIKEKLVDGMEDCTEIVSSYKDNPFLSQDYVQSLEELINQDYNKYRVYCLGEWGKVEDLIYNNWTTIQRIPEDYEVEKVFYGLDFGYKVESGLVRIKSRKNDLYEEELLYKTELTNTDLGQAIKKILPDKHKRTCKIYADNAEPDRIEELRREGLNVVPARKGPHSVRDGIDFIQRKKVHILESSVNLIKEKRAYSWKKDKATGKIIADEPVKFMDHLCLEGNTKIYTTSGPISIKDLVGQEGYTYCYSAILHRTAVKKFSNVQLTGKKKEVWKLILDNYTELILTPDHLVMLRDESWKEAGYLQIGESLMPFYCKIHNSYEKYLNINLNNGYWLQAHRLVYNDCVGEIPIDMTKWNVHHIDINSLNNNPDNLILLDNKQHASLHRKGAKFSDESRERLRYALKDIVYTEEEKQKRLENMKRAGSFAKLWHSSPEGIAWHKQQGIYTMDKAKNGVKINKSCQICNKNYEIMPINAPLSKYCSNNCKQKAGRIRNAEKRYNKSIGESNHKVLSIEFYGYEDVYNMEVEEAHNFVANGIIVHNCDAERMAVWSELGSTNTPKIWVIQ